MENIVELDFLKIYLPDGDRKTFLLYGDFRKLAEAKYQADAVKKIKNSLRGLNFKSQPAIYHEENAAGIRTKDPQIFVQVIQQLRQSFAVPLDAAFNEDHWNEFYQKLLAWKAPKRQKWKLGDIFSIELQDHSFAFGQVVGSYPTVALFDLKSASNQLLLSELTNKKIITIIHVTATALNNHTWKIVGHLPPVADEDAGPEGSSQLHIGHSSYSSNVLEAVCNYYWFEISKWVNEEELKNLLL